MSYTPTDIVLCPIWQTAAVLCRKLRSLHLEVRAMQFTWPGQIAYVKQASQSLCCDSQAEEMDTMIDLFDPWTAAKTR